MYAKDGLLRVDSVLTILIGKVCQKCNVPSVVTNSRLVQEFKTKIWRLNQALAKVKTQGGTYSKYSTWIFKIYFNGQWFILAKRMPGANVSFGGPIFWHDFSNETIKKYAVIHFFPGHCPPQMNEQ